MLRAFPFESFTGKVSDSPAPAGGRAPQAATTGSESVMLMPLPPHCQWQRTRIIMLHGLIMIGPKSVS
jgi:hypothetical protein